LSFDKQVQVTKDKAWHPHHTERTNSKSNLTAAKAFWKIGLLEILKL